MPLKGNDIALQVIEDPFGDTRPVVSPNPEVDGKKGKRERKVDDYFVRQEPNLVNTKPHGQRRRLYITVY
jgi:hypothetical protein